LEKSSSKITKSKEYAPIFSFSPCKFMFFEKKNSLLDGKKICGGIRGDVDFVTSWSYLETKKPENK
jgi:hypothetical protein